MVTHMKTTIDIADGLLIEAKKVAAREKSTIRALVEEGLRRALADRKGKKTPFKLKLVTVKGRGVQPGIDWELPRGLAYDLPSDEQ
jgi:hypothetical protein